MTTRADIRTEVRNRLGDPSSVVWTDSTLNGLIDFTIRGLYPTFYLRKVATSVAGAGPIQTKPAGARNLYMVGHKRATSTRVRPVRGWVEGDTDAFVPKTGITGDTLVWAWTNGFAPPVGGDSQVLDLTQEAEEVVILRVQVGALEQLLSDRVSADKYLALHVRAAVTETDIADTLDALHASLREREDRALPLPEVQR